MHYFYNIITLIFIHQKSFSCTNSILFFYFKIEWFDQIIVSYPFFKFSVIFTLKCV